MPKPTKPTGTIQWATITPTSVDVQNFDFPREKEEIEMLFAQKYVDRVKEVGIEVSIDKQNETNDLDFNVTLSGRQAYLELTEIAPLGVGGFKAAGESYEILSFAVSIAEQIEAKSMQCAAATEKQKLLLLYTTDWRFAVVPNALEHLQFLMHSGNHGFLRIDIIEIRADGSADLRFIYPAERQSWSEYDPKTHDGKHIVFADVSKPLPRDQWPDRR